MNAYRIQLASGAAWRWVFFPVMGLMLMVSGCETEGGAISPESRLHIENVAKWYQLYRADHAGKPPGNEDEFVEFIENKLKARGVSVDRDQLLTSPRDGQKYVINYGKSNSTNAEKSIAVYEKDGHGGKKLVGFELGSSRELDEAELQSLLDGSG